MFMSVWVYVGAHGGQKSALDHWESNSGPLKEQEAEFLTAGPFLQSHGIFFPFGSSTIFVSKWHRTQGLTRAWQIIPLDSFIQSIFKALIIYTVCKTVLWVRPSVSW